MSHFIGRRLWVSEPRSTAAEAIGAQKRAYGRAIIIVRAYYVVSAFWVVGQTQSWPTYARLQRATPLWPAEWWFREVSVRTGVNLIFSVYLIASLIVVLVPDRRLARAAYTLALLQYMSFVNSFDKVNHDLHGWLFVSIVLILLPRGPWGARRSTADRQYFLTVFWAAQLVLLLFYSLTGMWKIYSAIDAFAHGHINGFNLSAFSYIVGARLIQTNQDTVLGKFFVHNELPGWLLFTGTMYLETASLMIAFRPRVQRMWGLGLILFHVGTQLAMGFTFPENIVLVGLLLVCSPFAPDRVRVKDAFFDLPVVHFAYRRARSPNVRRM